MKKSVILSAAHWCYFNGTCHYLCFEILRVWYQSVKTLGINIPDPGTLNSTLIDGYCCRQNTCGSWLQYLGGVNNPHKRNDQISIWADMEYQGLIFPDDSDTKIVSAGQHVVCMHFFLGHQIVKQKGSDLDVLRFSPLSFIFFCLIWQSSYSETRLQWCACFFCIWDLSFASFSLFTVSYFMQRKKPGDCPHDMTLDPCVFPPKTKENTKVFGLQVQNVFDVGFLRQLGGNNYLVLQQGWTCFWFDGLIFCQQKKRNNRHF